MDSKKSGTSEVSSVSFALMWMIWLSAIGCILLLIILNVWGNRLDLTPFLKAAALVAAVLGGLCGVFGVLRSK